MILKRFDWIIDTIPAWKPVVNGLKTLTPGGRLVINAVRKEEFDKDDLLKLDYPQHLWKEKEIKIVGDLVQTFQVSGVSVQVSGFSSYASYS